MKVNVKDIRNAIVTYLETEGLGDTTELREKISKTLDISGDDVEKNLLFLQTKEKIAQKTVGGKQAWFVTKPKKEKTESPRDYKEYKRKIVFTMPCLGTFPIQEIYWIDDEKEKEEFIKRWKWDGNTMMQVHEMKRCDSKYYIWSGWIRGLLREGMGLVNRYLTTAKDDIMISDAEIHTNGTKMIQTHVSVHGGTKGGISRFEGIMPGSWAIINLNYPSNKITEEELDRVFKHMGSAKGFGAGHSVGWGKFEIQKIE